MKKYSIYTYRKLINMDKYISKKYYMIGYSYEHMAATYVWYKLYGKRVNDVNIKERPGFYKEPAIPKKYRASLRDYKRSGYDRGHLANDASFDYSPTSLHSVYSLANIVPQTHKLNSELWAKLERYGRYISTHFGYCYVINIMKYGDKKINNRVSVPETFYKVFMNNKHKFLRIFKVKQNSHGAMKEYLITYDDLIKDLK